MTICRHCGAQTVRIRTLWKGDVSRDECPHCAPQTFEAVHDPSTRKIWIGPEYNPNAYEKRSDADGTYYVAKPEFTAEQEAKVSMEATDEREARAKAEAKKRKERRTLPMTPAEFNMAIAKARLYVDLLKETDA